MKNNTVDSFLDSLRQQIELTCKIHKCKFEKMPQQLWDITLGAACGMQNIDFKRNGKSGKRVQSI